MTQDWCRRCGTALVSCTERCPECYALTPLGWDKEQRSSGAAQRAVIWFAAKWEAIRRRLVPASRAAQAK